jgi:hypothetical protein
MQKKWDNEHAQFWDRLLRERAAQIAGDPAWLKSVRYDMKEAEVLQRRFGYVWKESGTNIFKLVASAFGETWDEEDDQKNEARVACTKESAPLRENTRNHDDLVATREKGAREREHLLQREPEASECELEEAEGLGRGRGRLRLRSDPETEAQEEEKAGGRRKGFYRAAGGT